MGSGEWVSAHASLEGYMTGVTSPLNEAPVVIASQNLIIGSRVLIAETCKGASLLMNLIPSFLLRGLAIFR